MDKGRILSAVYYGGLVLLLVLIVTGSLADLVPVIGGHVSRNSEGLLIALLISAWIEFVRPAIALSSREWMLTAAAAAGCLACALLLLVDGVPTSLRTLNEAFFALVVLLPYVQLTRPLPRPAWVVPVVAVVVPVLGADSGVAVTLAETFAFLLLIPLALDVGDRSILEPERARNLPLVAGWLLLVIAVPVVLHLVRPDNPENLLEELARYLSRTTEAYVAVVCLHVYFSFLRPAVRDTSRRAGLVPA